MNAHLGPNADLIGKPRATDELRTPCLVVERELFEHNLELMAARAKSAEKAVRPHVKGHKCSVIGGRQVEAGAIGLSCATLREAEAMAAAGLAGILLTSPAATSRMIEQLMAIHAEAEGLITVVDNVENARDLDAAARQVGKPLGILVDVDVGQGRTGVTSEDAAVVLANSIADAPNLAYQGIQAYYGHLQHVPAYVDRLAEAREQWGRVELVARALREAGFAPEIMSGGGTGSHHLDLAEGPFTEIQPGSYLFMDRQYGDIEIDPKGSPPFVTSLSIQAQVVSANHPDRAIINAGFKAMATDADAPDFLAGAPEQATYQFMGDEHGGVMYASPPAEALGLSNVVRLRAPHCDPTINLHEFLHVVDGDTLVDIWPIDGRGY